MSFFIPKKTLTVETYGAGALSCVSAPVRAVDESIRALAEEMARALELFNGVGLAAPQMGVNLRLVVLGIPPDAVGDSPTPGELELVPRMPLALVNPEIISYSDDLVPYDEGCLSLPDIFGEVERPSVVRFRADTLDGDTIEAECGGLLGRCIQHELDHLEGKLFIDRMTPEVRASVDQKVRKLLRFGEKHHFQRKR